MCVIISSHSAAFPMEWSQVSHVRVDGSTIQLLFVVNLQVVDRFFFFTLDDICI